MTSSTNDAVWDLIRDALEVYEDDPEASGILEDQARRLEEPLRIAFAGMVKAGKSTLINALVGEDVAPTDVEECTRIVTWYRYAAKPRVTVFPRDGKAWRLPVRHIDGTIVFDTDDLHAHDIRRLVVELPAPGLRALTLIDTPGIASLSTDVSALSGRALIPHDATSEADAIVYVMRHLHEADMKFLRSLRDGATHRPDAVTALAVLSRADEVGAGRIDSLLAARTVARRYRGDETLRSLAMGVIPVAGRLAQTARTLRDSEVSNLAALARLDRPNRERLLMSADRFMRPDATTEVDADARAALLDRFGIFGIRLAIVLLQNGFTNPQLLARELVRRSGLDDLSAVISTQFRLRDSHLKSRAALVGIAALVRERPRPEAARLIANIERIRAGAHEFDELRLLATVQDSEIALPAERSREMVRLVGGAGTSPGQRLGLSAKASRAQLQSEALAAIHRWRMQAEHPLTDRSTADLCGIVVRSCEAILAQLENGSGTRLKARHLLSPEPDIGAGEKADDQPRAG
jgi:hypothetical protein